MFKRLVRNVLVKLQDRGRVLRRDVRKALGQEVHSVTLDIHSVKQEVKNGKIGS